MSVYWQYNTELAEKNLTLDVWDNHAYSESSGKTFKKDFDCKVYLESQVTSRFRADSLKMPRDSIVRQVAIWLNKKLHGGGRGGWEEVRSFWKNSEYEVGFCCKQK